MKRVLKTLLIISSIGILGVGCDRSPEKIAEKITKKMSKKLELNDIQKEKLEKVKVALLAEYKNHHSHRERQQDTIQQFILAETLDKAKAKQVLDSKTQRMNEKFEKHFPLIQDFHGSLDGEQKKKLAKFVEKMNKKRRHRRH